jgi:ATP-dependent DNA helicase RecQ
MTRKVPVTRQDFARISGVGEAKLRELSGPFIEVIKDYVKANGQVQSDEPAQALTEEKRPSIVGQTYLETGRIISAGATIAEAAEQRGIAQTTIIGHLERLVEQGEDVSLEHLLPSPERMKAINDAFDVMGFGLLRPVFDEMGGEVSYEDLRLVRMVMGQKGMMHLTPNN